MKEQLAKIVATHLKGFREEDLMKLIEVPPNTDMGDYSLPCFSLAKKMKMSPVMIAEQLQREIQVTMYSDLLSEIKSISGYLNFFLNRDFYIGQVMKRALQDRYGESTEGEGKTICMDYSSPNIAKNFHVGHLRTTLIGNSLYKIFTKLGYKVIRINHLGDWGTQFGKLIVAYQRWSSKEAVEKDGIDELLRIYQLFGVESEHNPQLQEEARSWFARMENGDEEALHIWKWFKEISLKEFTRIYQLLGVEFDYFTGESFYMDKVPALVSELNDKKLLIESQGANIINLDDTNMPPCIITKKDGSSIYHSRDIAAILFRKEEYKFDQCIYVTGSEQKLHFAQIFKVIELMGYEWSSGLVHVPYGLVSLDGTKLSSRFGNVIYAEDILKETVCRCRNLIEQKNSNLPDKELVAQMVGIGAVIFHDLYHQRIKDVDFSWDDVLNFDGASGPYVQYTYARAKSILKKSGYSSHINSMEEHHLKQDSEFILIQAIVQYPDKIHEAAERYEPSVLARYAIQLATAFNKFYQDCNILNAEHEVRNSRLVLVDITQHIIRDTMELLGIKCPEEM